MNFNASFVTILSIIVLATITERALAMPPAQCNPDLMDDVPPRIRKVCMALSNIYELGAAMEHYILERVMQQDMPLPDSGVKRQDVDHVFLRFGKR